MQDRQWFSSGSDGGAVPIVNTRSDQKWMQHLMKIKSDIAYGCWNKTIMNKRMVTVKMVCLWAWGETLSQVYSSTIQSILVANLCVKMKTFLNIWCRLILASSSWNMVMEKVFPHYCLNNKIGHHCNKSPRTKSHTKNLHKNVWEVTHNKITDFMTLVYWQIWTQFWDITKMSWSRPQ